MLDAGRYQVKVEPIGHEVTKLLKVSGERRFLILKPDTYMSYQRYCRSEKSLDSEGSLVKAYCICDRTITYTRLILVNL